MPKQLPVSLPKKYQLEQMADAMIQAKIALQNIAHTIPKILDKDRVDVSRIAMLTLLKNDAERVLAMFGDDDE